MGDLSILDLWVLIGKKLVCRKHVLCHDLDVVTLKVYYVSLSSSSFSLGSLLFSQKEVS